MSLYEMRGRLKQIARGVGLALMLFLAGIAGFLYYIGLFNGNVREVQPGYLYRSSHLSPARFSRVVREHGIRTVICLKGGDPSDAWFREQGEICRANGATLTGIRFSARELPKPKRLKKLLRLLDRSRYPLLVHCDGGADRSGLASTLYLHLYAGVPLDEAQRRGLTWRYGHFRSRAPAMDQFFDLYRAHGRGMGLRRWILQEYPGIHAAITAPGDRQQAASKSRPATRMGRRAAAGAPSWLSAD